MPVTKPKTTATTTRYPPSAAAQPSEAASGITASKKKKKKKGKGRAVDLSNSINPAHHHHDHDGLDDEEDDLPGLEPVENTNNDSSRRSGLSPELESVHFTATGTTASLNASAQAALRMSTTATAQAELLAAANELYRRMETEQVANGTNGGEYWDQIPGHIRSFVETTYAHGAALSASERSKSQAMLALAQTMVDEATSRFPPGAFPPFDPSDPKFTERLGLKHPPRGTSGLHMRDYAEDAYEEDYVSENDEDEMDEDPQYEADGM